MQKMSDEYKEIEVRFLEIDEMTLKRRLEELHAENLGEDLFEEIICYKDKEWLDYKRKFVKVRQTKNGAYLTYKHHQFDTAEGTEEIEIKVDDFDKTIKFLERTGLGYFMRRQQKKRHKYKLDGVTVDMDTWPNVPTYVELEGTSSGFEGCSKEIKSRLV